MPKYGKQGQGTLTLASLRRPRRQHHIASSTPDCNASKGQPPLHHARKLLSEELSAPSRNQKGTALNRARHRAPKQLARLLVSRLPGRLGCDLRAWEFCDETSGSRRPGLVQALHPECVEHLRIQAEDAPHSALKTSSYTSDPLPRKRTERVMEGDIENTSTTANIGCTVITEAAGELHLSRGLRHSCRQPARDDLRWISAAYSDKHRDSAKENKR